MNVFAKRSLEVYRFLQLKTSNKVLEPRGWFYDSVACLLHSKANHGSLLSLSDFLIKDLVIKQAPTLKWLERIRDLPRVLVAEERLLSSL